MRLFWAAVVTAFFGCTSSFVPDTGDTDTDTDTDADTDADTDTDTDTDADTDADSDTDRDTDEYFSVDVLWTGTQPSSAVEVVVHDPQGRTHWNFGMAETENLAGGWFGEDCYLGTGSYTLCHGFSGTTLELDEVATAGAVVEGATTLLWSELNLTYYLDDGGSNCWVWGHDTSYYGSLGCTDLGGTGPVWVRRGGCSGMDPADPAPLNGKIALTFDDGPSATVTPQILTTLRAHNVPATFMMLGENVDDPSVENIIDDIAGDPLFDIGNHSYDHEDLALLPQSLVEWEIEETDDALWSNFGVAPAFFRFPYGDATCSTADLVRDDYGFHVAGWHIDTADWCYASGGVCTRSEYWRIPSGFESDFRGYILDQAEAYDGGIMLLHDIHQYTASHLEDVILDLLDAGFTFVSLDNASAFPLLNSDHPYDFPWIGESCVTTDDTCWQVEYLSWCEPTGDPGEPATAGVCVLPCTGALRCIDRDGTSPLFCADVAGTSEDYCLARSTGLNDYCGDVPGTVETTLYNPAHTDSEKVCLPYDW